MQPHLAKDVPVHGRGRMDLMVFKGHFQSQPFYDSMIKKRKNQDKSMVIVNNPVTYS